MAWLQTSFTNHQLIGDSTKTNNLRKGYKVGSLNKNTDPDKSDTPLLLDGPLLDLRIEGDVTDSCDNTSVAEPKKTNLPHNIPSKPGFLSSNFFDRSSVVKTKPLPDLCSPTQTTAPTNKQPNKPKEGKNLLSFGKIEKPQVVEEDEDEDSDDDWFSPHASRGYQRVKTGTD